MKIPYISEKIWLGILMATVTSLGLMATDIYTPAMPVVTLALSTSVNTIQLTITVFLIAAGLSQLIYGPLSDHWGRRPILMVGLTIYILGSILCSLAKNIDLLLLGRFVQGLGTGAIMSLNRVIIKDAFSGVQLVKALSYIGAFVALAPAVAPALGGFIEMHWGWRWIFGFLLVYSILLGILSWLTLPETHHGRLTSTLSFTKVMGNYATIIKNRFFWANVWCSGLAFAAMIVCATINPFLLENGLGMTAAEYGFLAMISASGFMIGMVTNSYLVSRLGTERLITLGNLLILSMGLVFIITGYLKVMTVSTIILPTIGVELGIAWIFPNAFAGAITPFPTIAGAAGALYGCIQIGISFLTSAIVAMISESSQLPMGILLLGIAILGITIFHYLNRKVK